MDEWMRGRMDKWMHEVLSKYQGAHFSERAKNGVQLLGQRLGPPDLLEGLPPPGGSSAELREAFFTTDFIFFATARKLTVEMQRSIVACIPSA